MKETANSLFDELLASYLASNHRRKTDVIHKAYNFALHARDDEERLLHPLRVAIIASKEMGLGSTSICAALLHDSLDGTDYTIDDIRNIFGAKVAQIVDGLTKIAGGIFGDKAAVQAENFKKLLLTMSDDIRVILIKICDRLDNMRHFTGQPEEKKYKIAGETLYIYAPLANRLGLNTIKAELEDLAFQQEHPDDYAAISQSLAHTAADRDTLFDAFTNPIRQALDALGMHYTIKARVKTPYSIWCKMQRKHVSFDEVFDILAVRIIFRPDNQEEEAKECFNIYVELCKLYKSHPDRLRDWLSHPKANGYQALHVTLMSQQGRWIEVQIRSERMDDIAEQGFAAHWKYKSDDSNEAVAEDELNGWLQTIKEILDDPQPDAMDFLDAIKLNLFASEIFVFSPKGEIITLPAGSTALDYAFHIHTFLGTHCIGAKVNHRLVPLSHPLRGGDQIEIISSPAGHVHPEWLNFITTAKARGKIQTLLRKRDREEAGRGRLILEQWLAQNGLTLTTAITDRLAEAHGQTRPERLFIDIAAGTKTLGPHDLDTIYYGPGGREAARKRKRGWRKFVPFLKAGDTPLAKDCATRGLKPAQTPQAETCATLFITDDNIADYLFPDCCHPIPGDDILAYRNKKGAIEIHSRTCPEAARLQSSFGADILPVEWRTRGDRQFRTTLALRGIDRKGIIRDVTIVLADTFDINIHRLSTTSDDGIFRADIELYVRDAPTLQTVITRIKTINGMQAVSRT